MNKFENLQKVYVTILLFAACILLQFNIQRVCVQTFLYAVCVVTRYQGVQTTRDTIQTHTLLYLKIISDFDINIIPIINHCARLRYKLPTFVRRDSLVSYMRMSCANALKYLNAKYDNALLWTEMILDLGLELASHILS